MGLVAQIQHLGAQRNELWKENSRSLTPSLTSHVHSWVETTKQKTWHKTHVASSRSLGEMVRWGAEDRAERRPEPRLRGLTADTSSRGANENASKWVSS